MTMDIPDDEEYGHYSTAAWVHMSELGDHTTKLNEMTIAHLRRGGRVALDETEWLAEVKAYCSAHGISSTTALAMLLHLHDD
jgi:hypothetical protein